MTAVTEPKFDTTKFRKIIDEYKKHFLKDIWPKEKFKWQAVQHFQNTWDIDATDFAEMLVNALEPAKKLLLSNNNFPYSMIKEFVEVAPEKVRAMFRDLFDESKDVYKRIENFGQQSDFLQKEYKPNGNHYQKESAISTYLWLRYPDKYYLYKFTEARSVSSALNGKYLFKKGAKEDNIRNFFSFYDELSEELHRDNDLMQLVTPLLTKDCHHDSKCHTLAIDFGFFISKKFKQGVFSENEISSDLWVPAGYSPKLSVEDWKSLLDDESIFTESSLEIMKRMLDCGGQASCKQLAQKYGESINFYNAGSSSLAKRIATKTNCPTLQKNNYRWWPILYLGREAKNDEAGAFVWKLRDELAEALENIDLSQVKLYATHQPSFWKISQDAITEDEFSTMSLRHTVMMQRDSEETDFVSDIKNGDFFYICRGNSVRLLCQFDGDAQANAEKSGWYERKYSIIAQSLDTTPYTGESKPWTPNSEVDCIEILPKEKQAFEASILKHYFNRSIDMLLQKTSQNYWFLNANPKIWPMSNMPVGETVGYSLYNEDGRKRRIFQNFLDVKPDDMVVGYESTPSKQVVALFQVESGPDSQKRYFKKLEALSSPISYDRLKNNAELQKMEYLVSPQGSLFKLTEDEYDCILDMIREENPTSDKSTHEKYDRATFLSDVFMPENEYDRIVAVLKRKKNIILQGAPGVGKTYAAKRLAYSLMGEKDDDRIAFVQFHQSYSYEDFMLGYKPNDNGFELKEGIFYEFCKKALNNPNQEYYFIIDEINRGNLSKIFGELLMLIEPDYRDQEITLAYGGRRFSVPKSIHIIGLMNTADRSLAMMDYALRRRFSFIDMKPRFDTDAFQKKYQKQLANSKFARLISCIEELNQAITQDPSLGKGFCIGHSYFGQAETCDEAWMRSIVDYDILPMLEEYWFDDDKQLANWTNKLHQVFQ